MKLFSLFRGKNPESQPSEFQDYYRTQQSEHKSIAWLLAFATFVVTLLVILGLFFGGKWTYRKLAGRNKSTTTTQTTKPPSNGSADQSNNGSGSTEDATSDQTDVGTSVDETPQTSSDRTDTPSSAVVPNTGPTELIQTGEDYPYYQQ